MGATVIFDAGAGSSGKGKLSAYLAEKENYDYAICNWMINAGHFTELDDGTRYLVQIIPSSFINMNTKLVIGPGAAFDLETINKEIKMLDDAGFDISSRLIINPRAMIIEQVDRDYEKATIKSGSTFKGCGAASSRKILRKSDVKLARDVASEIIGGEVRDHVDEVVTCLQSGGKIIVEGAQGFDLDINYGLEYPHTTSRQCHPGQLVADCGIPMKYVEKVIANIRPFPIRISNTSAADGSHAYSGNYAEAKELTWDEVEKRGGFEEGELSGHHSNYTSVTKKLRRVFEFSWERFEYMCKVCGPTHLSVNFVNHLCKGVTGVKHWDFIETEPVVEQFLRELENRSGVNVAYVGTGPKMSEMVEKPVQYSQGEGI
jgi:adenylosuccinate synthase